MQNRLKQIKNSDNPVNMAALPLIAQQNMIEQGRFVAVNGAYHGASKKRRTIKEFLPKTGDADADSLADLPTLRSRSRSLLRNTPIATGAIKTNQVHVIGSGLKLQSRINAEVLNMTEDDADKWQQKTELEFRSWAESLDCDINRNKNFYDFQNLVFRSILESGDCFVLPLFKEISTLNYGLRLQTLEADRVENPNNKRDTTTLAGGVEKDKKGTPIRYWIRTQHPGAESTPIERKWDSISAFTGNGRRKIIHIYEQLRPGATRGVPYLSVVTEMLHQLGKYTDSELQSAVIASYFTVFVTTKEGGANFSTFMPSDEGGESTDEDYQLGSGAIIGLADGEEMSTANPGRPNATFDPFVMSILRQIGAALGLPYELLIQHFTKSYSAARTAMLNAWKVFLTRRSFMVDHFCDLVYELWMEEAVLRERIIAPGFLTEPLLRKAYLQNLWIGPAAGQIDPVKETASAQARVDGFFSNISIESAAMGIDFDQNMKQVKKERVKLAEIQQIMTPLIKASVDINENVDEINDNVDNPLNEEVDDNANA
jgi:lambda family phage portal protein